MLIGFLCTVLSLLVFIGLKLYAINKRLPPGPPIIFVYLSLLKERSRNACNGFKILRQQYGDVFSLSLGLKTTIVVNGLKSIREVFFEKDKITSNRPDNFFFKHAHDKTGICL